jgi:hypothetical protein
MNAKAILWPVGIDQVSVPQFSIVSLNFSTASISYLRRAFSRADFRRVVTKSGSPPFSPQRFSDGHLSHRHEDVFGKSPQVFRQSICIEKAQSHSILIILSAMSGLFKSEMITPPTNPEMRSTF